jgi:hypothetical protein
VAAGSESTEKYACLRGKKKQSRRGGSLVSLTDSPLRIQTAFPSLPRAPSWFGEATLIARAQAGWFLTDQYLFTLAHQAVSSDILISLRNPWAMQAAHLIQEGLKNAGEAGDQISSCFLLRLHGDIKECQGNPEQAIEHYREGLFLTLKLKESRWQEDVGRCLLGRARVARAKGHLQQAAHLLGAVEPWLDSNMQFSTLNTDPVDRATYERDVIEVRAQLGEEMFASLWEEGRTMTPEQVLAAATDTGGEGGSLLP